MSKARDLARAGTALTSVDATELGYLDGVTSAVQTQLNNKLANSNPVINGAFDIWQRGTSFTAADVYTADRWKKDSQTYSTISRQTTSDTTNLPNIQYATRVQRNSGQTGTVSLGIIYCAESADAIRYAGQSVVVSFYARAGANYSSASSAIGYNFYTGTGTDQSRSFSVQYTGEANIASSTRTLTTTWQRFNFTATIGATATEWGIMFFFNGVGTAGANDWFEITGVQIDLGSTPLPFRRSGSTIQDELAACQRYYQRRYGKGNGTPFGAGQCYSTTAGIVSLPFPVTLRTTPSLASSGLYVTNSTFGSAGGTIAIYSQTSSDTYAAIATSASGLVAGDATSLVGTDANSYLELSAEL